MPLRFLESMYRKLSKKELIDVIYMIGDKADIFKAQRNHLAAQLLKAQRKIKKLKAA